MWKTLWKKTNLPALKKHISKPSILNSTREVRSCLQWSNKYKLEITKRSKREVLTLGSCIDPCATRFGQSNIDRHERKWNSTKNSIGICNKQAYKICDSEILKSRAGYSYNCCSNGHPTRVTIFGHSSTYREDQDDVNDAEDAPSLLRYHQVSFEIPGFSMMERQKKFNCCRIMNPRLALLPSNKERYLSEFIWPRGGWKICQSRKVA